MSLAWLIGRLEQRSFGLLMLILGLHGLTPGIATFAGFLLAFPAVQMMLGRESAALPRFLAARSIPARHFGRLTARTVPLFERMETLIRPRLHTPFQATKRVVGLVALLLTATAIWPVPFSHVIPMLVIILVALAYLEEMVSCSAISLVAALISLSISAAITWATVRATGLIEGLWIGAEGAFYGVKQRLLGLADRCAQTTSGCGKPDIGNLHSHAHDAAGWNKADK